MSTQPFIKWFADTTIEDIPIVGGKNASLGEMFREFGGRGVRIPNGFSITAGGYRHFIREAELDPVIRAIRPDSPSRAAPPRKASTVFRSIPTRC